MTASKLSEKYVAFLRGINVGGHHKVPMAELRAELEHLGCINVISVLNSGNVIFNFTPSPVSVLEEKISNQLEIKFDFSIPTIIFKASDISQIYENSPFKDETILKEIRLYISFLKEDLNLDEPLKLPWESPDKSYSILKKKGRIILSKLDLTNTTTPKAMKVLEDTYGKKITTRNWKTIERIINTT